MGEVLSSLFVDPEILPGGSSCVSLRNHSECLEILGKNCTLLPYPINCDDSASCSLCLTHKPVCTCSLFLTRTHGIPSAEGYGDVQVFFLMFVYASVLSWASNMISDGSELLLLVPSMRGRCFAGWPVVRPLTCHRSLFLMPCWLGGAADPGGRTRRRHCALFWPGQ
jgi:hypothetical protein